MKLDGIRNNIFNLSSDEKANLINKLFDSMEDSYKPIVLEGLKIHKKQKTHFSLFSWLSQAREDLKIAKLESSPSFIRCFHAQQAMEKILKAAFIVSNGRFYQNSDKLTDERKKSLCSTAIKSLPNCAWELNEDVYLPFTHNLSSLWRKLIHSNPKIIQPLNSDMERIFNTASNCAVRYRYPYFSETTGFEVGFIGGDEMEQVVKTADELYHVIREFIHDKINTKN